MRMKVEDVLQEKGRNVHTIDGTVSLKTAAAALHRQNIGCIAVSVEGKVCGFIGEREITHAVAQGGKEALEVEAREVMARLSVCLPTDDIDAVSRRMTTERVRHLLVRDGESVEGIISIGDVLKRRLNECRLEVDVLRDYARTRIAPH